MTVQMIGDLVRQRRKSLAHSQHMACSIMGVTQSYLSRLERGIADPAKKRQEIANYLAISLADVDDLITNEYNDGDVSNQLAQMSQALRSLSDQVYSLEFALFHMYKASSIGAAEQRAVNYE